MKTRADGGRILADELGRVLEQFQQVDEQAGQVLAERKRAVHVAQGFLELLRGLVGVQASAKLIDDFRLGGLLARLPGVTGPKPASKAEGRLGKRPGTIATQVSQDSRGKTREVLSDVVPAVEPGAGVVVPEAPTVVAPVQSTPPTVEAAAPVQAVVPAASTPQLPAGVLQKGTPIRMMAGHHRGCSGMVTSVHLTSPGPKPDAIYMLALTMPDGSKVRVAAKQSSLGRTWAKAA